MTNRKQALIELRDKVKAGEMGDTGPDRFTAIPKRGVGVYFDQNWRDAGNAYWHGDLNAAKALHEAVLPGCSVQITDTRNGFEDIGRWIVKINWEHMTWQPTFTAAGPFGYEGKDYNPARAWLLAILEALIAEVDA